MLLLILSGIIAILSVISFVTMDQPYVGISLVILAAVTLSWFAAEEYLKDYHIGNDKI